MLQENTKIIEFLEMKRSFSQASGSGFLNSSFFPPVHLGRFHPDTIGKALLPGWVLKYAKVSRKN
jgi:hypothetical protein